VRGQLDKSIMAEVVMSKVCRGRLKAFSAGGRLQPAFEVAKASGTGAEPRDRRYRDCRSTFS